MQDIANDFATPRRTMLLESDGIANSAAADNELQLKIADDPCKVLFSASGLIARIVGTNAISAAGPRVQHDAIKTVIETSNLATIGVLTADGYIHHLRVLDIPAIPATENAPSLTAGSALSDILMLEKSAKIINIIALPGPQGENTAAESENSPEFLPEITPLAIATKQGKIKRVVPDYPARAPFEVIKLSAGDEIIGAANAADDSQIVLITSDAQLLRFDAAAVRPQGRTGQGIAGIRLNEAANVIAFAAVPANDLAAQFVVTIANSAAAIPGTQPGSVKVSPLDRFPAKGRATGGVRAQRFLRGEDQLSIAWVGQGIPRAVSASGAPIDLPDIDERRDASGTQAAGIIAAIG
ncbi:DNA gyrase C-terminal beta-propeller domain-containing protein [Arcanobacterium hippocoleae]